MVGLRQHERPPGVIPGGITPAQAKMRNIVTHLNKIMAPVLTAVMLLSLPAAAAETRTVQVSAEIGAVLQLGVSVIKMPEDQITGGSSLNFGELSSDVLYGPMRARTYFKVLLYPNASGRPYRITQTATAPSNGNVSLPAGACIVTPWPVDANGQAQPAGSSVSGRQSFVQNDIQIYSSDPNGRSTSVVATYAITNDPAAGAYEYIRYDQEGGAYSSQAVFTIALI